MLLSACMIVKNEEEVLEKTLPVIASLMDEVILVDTGSSDKTVKIARKYGAKVFHFPWINDFAAARNESIKHAGGDWIIWIDADEILKKDEFEKVREFLSNAKGNVYNIKICECPQGTFDCTANYFRTKIFRNNRGFKFERPINEHLIDCNYNAVNGDLITSASIYHWGAHRKAEVMELKINRNIHLLKAVLENDSQDKYFHFLLANNYRNIGYYEGAINEYEKAVNLDSEKQFASSAYVSMGWCHYNLKKPKEAYQCALQALKLNPKEVSAYNILGALALGCGHPKEAVELLTKADAIEDIQDVFRSVNIGSTRYYANYFIGQAYEKMGQKEEAVKHFKIALELDQTDEVKQKLEELKCR